MAYDAARTDTRDGTEAQNFVDLYKEGHFLLEAKDAEEGKSTDLLLRRAFGQARTYAAHVPGAVAPPYILVLDVAKTLLVWDRWSGSFGGYAAHIRRIDLPTLHQLPDDIALLVDIWQNPSVRDPRSYAQAVTKDIAGKLATLAASLEDRGFEQERVAKFLMRCVFAMFAEDVGLLPREAFRQTVQNAGLGASPEVFEKALEALWKAMDEGGLFGYEKFLRFNGRFFKHAEALSLTREDIALLLEASKADWKEVEPTIFGTLLVRALDPEERHRLGAEYTPRAFIERLVRPTVEEPIRERWTAVQADVLQLRQSGKSKDRAAAESRLREFHAWMRQLKFLDPACGSGNFLYVTMHLVKEIEREVVTELEEVTGAHELRLAEVSPAQFYGIEVKPWAREIAELVLWIGFHQHWRRHHAVQPPEPVLQDTGTLECRDAVLAWDAVIHRPERDRPDPTPRLVNPMSGDLVPDPGARLPYLEHIGAKPAPWPEADFIIGNPPYLGKGRQRDAFGDGYVDALRAAYDMVPDAADYVMYWWYRAARAVASGRTCRAGLITTNTITQAQNRLVVDQAQASGSRVIWAIPDHPWVDDSDAAAVRVAMTVMTRTSAPPALATSIRVSEAAEIVATHHVLRLNSDLSPLADVATAATEALRANEGLSFHGPVLVGSGFILEAGEGRSLIATHPSLAEVIRPYRNGRDLTQRPRDAYVVDFGLRTEAEARDYPVAFDLVRDRVKPVRDANKRAAYRLNWWRFGEPQRQLRSALQGLSRYIATPETTKHRVFRFLSSDVVPDYMLICIASSDAYHLGVLSSAIHVTWALAAGGRLGDANTPRYNNKVCFFSFPFPDPPSGIREEIRQIAERIDAHRETALAADSGVTITGMYNIIEKMNASVPLTKAELQVHRIAACGVLRDLHISLDRLVAEAYGWSWPEPPALILERLVALHDQRVEEERAGRIKWLRPEYQVARFGEGDENVAGVLALGVPESTDDPSTSSGQITPWPSDAVGQITVLRQIASEFPISVDGAMNRLTGAKRDLVERHLQTLAILGEVQLLLDGRYAAFASVI